YWLAHAHQGIIVVVPQDALVVLGRSPISRLPWAPLVLDKLQAVGLRYLRDVWRLPRDSLVRRFGAEVLHQMDRARGDAADPRVAYVAPMQFSAGLTLPAPTADSAALVFATQRLLLEFAGFLRARGAGIQHFELHLIDAQTNLTQVNVGTATVHRQVAQWRVLVREHLEKLQLSAPVEQLRLHAEHITPIADSHDDLFDRTQHIGEGELWMARVRARLGEEVIQGMCAVAEHRPEYAWRATPPTLAPQKDQLDIQAHYRAGRTPERPLWLLATPLALQIKNGRLWREGALHRVRGPERIESGWWDAAPIARDYYVVENAAGIRYWVFREEGEWFLHGVFW
ncbi:MAG: DNA polymerase Y family protein, partial [Gammaproteobacteria bacterium]|nr:DNA polymerase Y family protein [Gammaproteobacteria bacterium]